MEEISENSDPAAAENTETPEELVFNISPAGIGLLLLLPAFYLVKDLRLVWEMYQEGRLSNLMLGLGGGFLVLILFSMLVTASYRTVLSARERKAFRTSLVGRKMLLDFDDAGAVIPVESSGFFKKGFYFKIVDRRNPDGTGVVVSRLLGQDDAAEFARTDVPAIQKMLKSPPQ